MTQLHDREEIERLVAALEASEARFRALIENSRDVTTIVDAAGAVRYVSPSVEKILGYRPEEIVGATVFDFVHPDDVDEIGEVLARSTQNGGSTRTNEFRARHADGSWRLLESTALNLLDDAAVGGMVITTRDITSRRALESRLVQAERLEAIGQLAGGIAHDFNNVLLVIRGYSSVLRSTLEDPQQIADVDEIASAADRAADLTRQLLAFGRRQVLQPRVVSVVEVVSGIESLLRRSLREDIRFELELPETPPAVIADAGQMEQVLLNLVVNARDAIEGPGVVAVSVAEADVLGDEEGIAPQLPPGRYVTLTVADTGSGIDPTVLPHIFEPFFTTKEDGVGTGLGLSTVYGIVAQSGGGIDVRRRDGGGTAFVVYLPIAVEERSDDDPRELPGDSPPVGDETILVVEDEEPVRELVRRVLEGAGYVVLAAAGPSEAERLLTENERVDLMLSDVVMPEMSGYDLAVRVRERRPEIRLLFMSGYAHRVSGSENFGGELLKKPFAPEQLARVVRAALDGDLEEAA
ncbi:MAG TPA: PAS domain S-box protein [Gaiellaceae bacterium]|nr:PAS domain S-box protein [Gaiellaceae bacterium]